MRRPSYTNIKQRAPTDPLTDLRSYMPRSVYEKLKHHAEMLGLPISKLVCFAVDNELDTVTPFNYNIELPKGNHDPTNYAHEAGSILAMIKRFPNGTGKDMLMLLRRDMNIESKDVFLLAYKALLETNQIEEFYPKNSIFLYKSHYRYVREKKLNQDKLNKTKYRKNGDIDDGQERA